MPLRKFASHVGSEKKVTIERHGDSYLIATGPLIREVSQNDLLAALAKRPDLLAQALSGKVPTYVADSSAGLRRLMDSFRTPHTGRVTRLMADQDKRTYRAILREDGGAVVWIDARLLDTVGVSVGDTVSMDGAKSPVRVGNTVIAPAVFTDADVDIATTALVAAGRAKAAG